MYLNIFGSGFFRSTIVQWYSAVKWDNNSLVRIHNQRKKIPWTVSYSLSQHGKVKNLASSLTTVRIEKSKRASRDNKAGWKEKPFFNGTATKTLYPTPTQACKETPEQGRGTPRFQSKKPIPQTHIETERSRPQTPWSPNHPSHVHIHSGRTYNPWPCLKSKDFRTW